MLLRASNAVGYSNYPDNLVKEFIRISAIKGIDVFRVFDSLNWIENMKMPIEESLKTGKIVEGALCYTGDILNPNEVKYTLDYYVKKAKELEAMGVHILAIKDMAGLLKPYSAYKLVETLKSELKIPVHLHTHDTTGAGVATVLKAAEAGVDIADLAIESMAGCTSQPSLNVVVEALRGTERDTGLEFEGLNELARYYEHVRKVYAANESGQVSPLAEIYKHEIPGGQYSNLLAQVTEMGSKDEFEKIKELYRQANILLGNLIKVTPSSKVVGDLAIFMSKNGLNMDNILTEGAGLSYPDSVIDFFKGMIGQPEGGFPKELQKIVLKDIEPITVRPGTLLPDVDFEQIKQLLREKFDMEGRVYVAELKVLPLYESVSAIKTIYKALPKHPASVRDLAVLADADMPVADIANAISAAIPNVLEKVELFDVYQGKQVPEGKKSVAYSITLRAADRTLTVEECDNAVAKVMKALDKIGVALRQ